MKCANISDELFEMVHVKINYKWFCDGCLKSFSDFKVLTKSVDNYHNDVVVGLNDVKIFVQNELVNVKACIELNNGKLDKFGKNDVDFVDNINSLKKEINTT